MRQWCHEICIYLVHLTLPIMMMECFPRVGAFLAFREDREAEWRLVVGQANQSQEEAYILRHEGWETRYGKNGRLRAGRAL